MMETERPPLPPASTTPRSKKATESFIGLWADGRTITHP
jgi:hypothetical protein